MSESEQIVNLDPAKVLADDNSRFGLKPTAVSTLMESILEHGGVMEPVEVEPLEKNKEGFTHRLTYGFQRHAAVSRLNMEQNAGLTLPAIVRETEGGAARTRRQIAENNARETMSPMDKAVAIKKLLDSGVEKPEIRRIFASAGGRKGNTVAPMSNAMLNILLNLLDLPKSIQEKIHSGLVGVEAAYMLGKVPADKRTAVMERAEANRLAQIEAEEKDEEKFLNAEKRVEESVTKVAEAAKQADEAKAEIEQAEANLAEKVKARKAVKMAVAEKDGPADKDDVERMKAAEADEKAAHKLLKDAKNKLAKALETRSKAQETVEEVKAKLEESRKAAKKKGSKATIGKQDVKKAAAEEGTKTGYVALNIGDIRQAIKDMSAGKLDADDRVAAIAQVFKDCFDGKDTEKQTVARLHSLLDAMGAKVVKKVGAAAPAPAPVEKKK